MMALVGREKKQHHHHHHHHHHHARLLSFLVHGWKRKPPKGCIPIMVGSEGEKQRRFIVPVEYLNHHLFAALLKEAEKEFGFQQEAAITIPCHVQRFLHVLDNIRSDSGGAAAADLHSHGHHHGGGHLHISGCFKS